MTASLPYSSADNARALTDRIKVAVEGTWHLITEAYTSRAWSALGYNSWDDYCTREFGTSRLRLPREDRSEVVASLRESGLSVRAIAVATGIARNTVRSSLREVGQVDPPVTAIASTVDIRSSADDEPALTQEECEALDAETNGISDELFEPELSDAEQSRQAAAIEAETKPRITGVDGKSYPKPEPKTPQRKPLPDAFWRATYDLGKEVKRIQNLAADDRFNKNADQVAQANLNDLVRARDALQGVIEKLTK